MSFSLPISNPSLISFKCFLSWRLSWSKPTVMLPLCSLLLPVSLHFLILFEESSLKVLLADLSPPSWLSIPVLGLQPINEAFSNDAAEFKKSRDPSA